MPCKWFDATERKPKVGELVWVFIPEWSTQVCNGSGQLSTSLVSAWWNGKEWRSDLIHHKFNELNPRYWMTIQRIPKETE